MLVNLFSSGMAQVYMSSLVLESVQGKKLGLQKLLLMRAQVVVLLLPPALTLLPMVLPLELTLVVLNLFLKEMLVVLVLEG